MNPETIDVIENDHRYFHQDHRLDVLNNHDLTLLRSFPNVVVTPHIAWASQEALLNMTEILEANITAFAEGRPQNAL